MLTTSLVMEVKSGCLSFLITLSYMNCTCLKYHTVKNYTQCLISIAVYSICLVCQICNIIYGMVVIIVFKTILCYCLSGFAICIIQGFQKICSLLFGTVGCIVIYIFMKHKLFYVKQEFEFIR